MALIRDSKIDKPPEKLRLDKWLWAARFYKTRANAKQAIESGKVYCDGHRTKPGKAIERGMELKLRKKSDVKIIIVKALSDKRRGAVDAQLLYEETPESIANREHFAELRKAQPKHWSTFSKPNKKQRRMIHRFKQRDSV